MRIFFIYSKDTLYPTAFFTLNFNSLIIKSTGKNYKEVLYEGIINYIFDHGLGICPWSY